MSLSDHRYNLRTGPFGLCSGYWDEANHVFRRADETEQGDCCLRTCKPVMDECKKICSESKIDVQTLCEKSCFDIREACESNCKLSSPIWGRNNPIYKGTIASGCGDGIYNKLNHECVLNNKNDIINVCRHSCTQTDKLDCDQHCEYSYNMISDEKFNPLYYDIPQKSSSLQVKSKVNNVNINIIIYAIAIAVIIFGLWILATM